MINGIILRADFYKDGELAHTVEQEIEINDVLSSTTIREYLRLQIGFNDKMHVGLCDIFMPDELKEVQR